MSAKGELLVLKGMIFDLTKEEQAKVMKARDEIRAIVDADVQVGVLAISLCALELQAES